MASKKVFSLSSPQQATVHPRPLPELIFPGQVQPLAVSVPVPAALATRADEVLARATQHGLPVRPAFLLPLFTGYRLAPGHQYDWVVLPASEDPLFHDRDGFPLPQEVIRTLQRVREADLGFDTFYLAHEVPKGTVRPGETLTAERLAPPPKQAVRLSYRLGALAQGVWTVAAMPAAAMVAGAAAAALMPLATILVIDPILFGVVIGRGRRLAEGEWAAWFYLTHWAYNE